MFSRVLTVAVAVCFLGAANPAMAQKLENALTSTITEVPLPSFPQDVATLWLRVIKNGQNTWLHYPQELLAGLSCIDVDGYVNGIVLLCKAPLEARLDDKPMQEAGVNADGFFRQRDLETLSCDGFGSSFPAGGAELSNGAIQGCYASFPIIPGDALSYSPVLPVSVKRGARVHALTIRQDAPLQLHVQPIAPVNVPAPGAEVFFLGQEAGRYAPASKAFGQRIQAFFNGIRTVERCVGIKIVDRINILESKRNNAYTCEDENQIWIYSNLFWNEPVAELKAIAEHEAMHILNDRLGLDAKTQIRKLFADLWSFGDLSAERFFILTKGQLPDDMSAGDGAGAPHIFFDFINERNFMRGMKGGHARDNLDEFCASFLHTLIYIDRFEALLEQPVIKPNGACVTLTAGQRAEVFDFYMRMLVAITKEIPGGFSDRLISMFQQCLATVRRCA